MTDEIFTTTISVMAEKIQMLEYRLERAEKENLELRSQVNDMYIKVHIGKEDPDHGL